MFQWDYSGSPGGGFIQVSSMGQQGGEQQGNPAPDIKEEEKPGTDDNANAESESEPGKVNQTGASGNPNQPGAGGEGGFLDGTADTTSLVSIYKETTRNVSMRYPSGWKFLDQNVKNKLDGVTFWYGGGNINPPPYIFLEVKEKYLFNEKSFKYKSDQGHHIFYYNDPTEMAGQVSQIIYVRTESDEDYSIKLIIQGWDAFNAFKSTFYGIIKTFKFGRSFF